MCSPSGDHECGQLCPGASVSSSTDPPSFETTPTLVVSPRFTSTASHLPSGDHEGKLMLSLLDVTRRRPADPSRAWIQTFIVPLSSSVQNANSLPSGETRGKRIPSVANPVMSVARRVATFTQDRTGAVFPGLRVTSTRLSGPHVGLVDNDSGKSG